MGFVTAAIALGLGRPWWAQVLLLSALFSLLICILDWKAAHAGGWINVGLLVVLFFVFGLRQQPAPFPSFAGSAEPFETAPLPSGLPKPVERFYRQTYGERIPVYHSAVMSGRGTLRFMGITFPTRLRFSHIAGQDYRHYIEACFYGLPVMKVNEWYRGGHSRLELPFGVVENDPGVDSAANQGLWAESLAFPAVLLTDARIRWEALDATHATLIVPFGDGEQVFTIQFDPQSGELVRFETVRYFDAKVGKRRWWGGLTTTPGRSGGSPIKVMDVVWEHEGTPWLIIELEEMSVQCRSERVYRAERAIEYHHRDTEHTEKDIFGSRPKKVHHRDTEHTEKTIFSGGGNGGGCGGGGGSCRRGWRDRSGGQQSGRPTQSQRRQRGRRTGMPGSSRAGR